MLILGILMLIVFIGGVGAVAQRANRPISRTGTSAAGKAGSGGKAGSRASTGRKSAATGGRSGGARKPSWLLKAWNATGAPKTSETTLGGAGAVVTGKAAGAVSRGGWLVTRKTGRAGRWFASRALIPFDKWLAKKRAGLENAAAFSDATPIAPDNTEPYIEPDIVHDAEPPRGPKLDTRTIDDFTAEDLWCTPRGRLALKEHEFKVMTAAFQKLKDAGDIDDEAEAEHMANRRRIEREIAHLRKTLNVRTTPEPAAAPPPVFVHPTEKPSKGEHVNGPTTNSAPATLAAHLNYINDFEPESDADLLNMMGAEVAGKAAEAEAYMELFDRCVSGAGLDPQAMQGVSDYSEAIAESAEAMKRAHQQFVAVYGAILEATENGTVLPHDGRFFSGEANVA